MEKNIMKNMLILKNLPSNIADEAIVILKPNIKLKSLNYAEIKKEIKNERNSNAKDEKRYIVNEAEMVISNYLSKMEKQNKNLARDNKNIERKYKKARLTSVLLGILLFLSFCF